MYQPSSWKGKLIKYIFLVSYPILKLSNQTYDNNLLEVINSLGEVRVFGIYFSTDRQKYIVLAYCMNTKKVLVFKLSNTLLGISRLKREINGYDLFKSAGLTHFERYHIDVTEHRARVSYSHEDYNFNVQNTAYVCNLVGRLRRGKKLSAHNHPRIKSILAKIEDYLYPDIFENLRKRVDCSETEYELCYEHGDLAPWNCYQKQGCYGIFDFEYFEYDGIEGFDLIRYAYSIAMIKGGSLKDRLQYVSYFFLSIDEYLDEFLVVLFLCDEISRKIEDDFDYTELEECIQTLLSS